MVDENARGVPRLPPPESDAEESRLVCFCATHDHARSKSREPATLLVRLTLLAGAVPLSKLQELTAASFSELTRGPVRKGSSFSLAADEAAAWLARRERAGPAREERPPAASKTQSVARAAEEAQEQRPPPPPSVTAPAPHQLPLKKRKLLAADG